MVPKATQDGPREVQDGSKTAQERSKTASDGFRPAPEVLKTPQDCPQALQIAPRRPKMLISSGAHLIVSLAYWCSNHDRSPLALTRFTLHCIAIPLSSFAFSVLPSRVVALTSFLHSHICTHSVFLAQWPTPLAYWLTAYLVLFEEKLRAP